MVTPVMCNALEKINGISSIQTRNDLALRNADRLNAGSSAIERLFAASEPDSSDSLRSPIFT